MFREHLLCREAQVADHHRENEVVVVAHLSVVSRPPNDQKKQQVREEAAKTCEEADTHEEVAHFAGHKAETMTTER